MVKGYKEHLSDARKLFRKKQHDQALEVIDKALAEQRSAQALTLKADILLDKRDFQAALATVEQAIAVGSRYADAWLIKGQIHFAKEDYAAAKSAFERYLSLKPTGREAEQVRLLLESIE